MMHRGGMRGRMHHGGEAPPLSYPGTIPGEPPQLSVVGLFVATQLAPVAATPAMPPENDGTNLRSYSTFVQPEDNRGLGALL